MPFNRPTGLLAGFSADAPDAAVPEIFDIGEQWAPHTFPIRAHSHHIWELYLQLDGWSTWEDQSGAIYRVEPVGLLVMPPHLVHWLVERDQVSDAPVSRKHHFLYAGIDIDAILRRLPQLVEHWDSGRARHIVDAADCAPPFRQLIREVSIERIYRTEALRNAIDGLVLEATRLLAALPPTVAHVRTHPAVARSKELLDRQFSHPWTLADLGRVTGVSPNHLSVLFSREVGMPPRQYLLRARIEHAEALLQESDIGVTSLALELGFSSSQHFATAFKHVTGLTPTEWRARGGRNGAKK